MKILRYFFVFLLCGVSCILWLDNFLNSPAWDKNKAEEQLVLRKKNQQTAPELAEERGLAQAYWSRYPGVRNSLVYGENSPMGILGAREHYRVYGKKEGRIFGSLIHPPHPDQTSK